MIQKLSFSEWVTAQKDLEAIIQRARLLDVPGLNPMLERALVTLGVDAHPSVSGIELEYTAALLRRYPRLREDVLALSRKLVTYPMTETLP